MQCHGADDKQKAGSNMKRFCLYCIESSIKKNRQHLAAVTIVVKKKNKKERKREMRINTIVVFVISKKVINTQNATKYHPLRYEHTFFLHRNYKLLLHYK